MLWAVFFFPLFIAFFVHHLRFFVYCEFFCLVKEKSTPLFRLPSGNIWTVCRYFLVFFFFHQSTCFAHQSSRSILGTRNFWRSFRLCSWWLWCCDRRWHCVGWALVLLFVLFVVCLFRALCVSHFCCLSLLHFCLWSFSFVFVFLFFCFAM